MKDPHEAGMPVSAASPAGAGELAAPGARGGTRDLSHFGERPWVRVANTILDRIASGAYSGRLPYQPVIAAEFGVSRNVVQRAEHKIAARDVIYRIGPIWYVRPEGGGPGDPQGQVRLILAGRMASGKLRAGDTVPARKQLADELGVSAFAVTEAFGSMADEGLIRFEQGTGYFVTRKGAALAQDGGQP